MLNPTYPLFLGRNFIKDTSSRKYTCIFSVILRSNMQISSFYLPIFFSNFILHPFFAFHVDPRRRNSYKNQPKLMKWNLLKLAEAIQDALPLQKSSSALEEL